jgi:DNA-binding NarL/FixJ family response regulator
VALLYRGHALAEALACGLRMRGWHPDVAERGAARTVALGQPLVLVEDDRGALPELPALAGAAGRHGARVVAVAGPATLAGPDALATIARALAAGATAVNAELPYRRLLTEVHDALGGEPYSPAQRERVLQNLRQRADETRRFHALTRRECAVLADVAAGRSAEAIAASRPVALATVRTQIAAVLRKLGVGSQPAAVALTYRSCADWRIMEALWRFHQNYG